MIKRIATLLIFVILLSLLVSCYKVPTEKLALKVLGDKIPHFSVGDIHFSKIRVLEEDSYGRILYIYQPICVSPSVEDCLFALLIAQKVELGKVYFYEDINHILLKTGDKAIDINNVEPDDVLIAQIKTFNDWEKDLNVNKMSYEKVKVRLNDVIVNEFPDNDFNYSEMQDLIQTELNITDDQMSDFTFVDYDGCNYTLFFVIANKNDKECCYFYAVSHDKRTQCIEIADIYNYQSELIQFKIDIGWKFKSIS